MIKQEDFFPGKKVWFVRSRFGSVNDVPNESYVILTRSQKSTSLDLYVYDVQGYKERIIQDEIYEHPLDYHREVHNKKEKEKQKYIPISGYI